MEVSGVWAVFLGPSPGGGKGGRVYNNHMICRFRVGQGCRIQGLGPVTPCLQEAARQRPSFRV